MRQEFELTEEELAAILKAIDDKPLIILLDGRQSTPQERANKAWEKVAEARGFHHLTVRPMPEKGPLFFTAELRDSLSGEVQAPETLQPSLPAETKPTLH